jgi:hypothetical protein
VGRIAPLRRQAGPAARTRVAIAVLLVAAVLVDANPPKPKQSPSQATSVKR